MGEQWLIIVHPDGRRYSVTRETLETVYAPQGFTEEGLETDGAFVANVPQTPKRVGSRRKSVKTSKPGRVAAPDEPPAGSEA